MLQIQITNSFAQYQVRMMISVLLPSHQDLTKKRARTMRSNEFLFKEGNFQESNHQLTKNQILVPKTQL